MSEKIAATFLNRLPSRNRLLKGSGRGARILIVLLGFLLAAYPVDTPSCSEATPTSHGSTAPRGRSVDATSRVHASSIAGSWYPGSKDDLTQMLDGFRSHVVLPEGADDNIIALLSPHAGYVYSGAIAAYGFHALEKRHPKRIIILGPTHHAYFQGVSIGDYDFYQTPLGYVPVDVEAANLLRPCPLAQISSEAHRREHSLDIQIPFIQTTYKGSPPSIIPILVGQLAEEDYPRLADCIRSVIDDETLIVVSSDFTHYGPNFSYVPFPCDAQVATRLRALDQGALDYIQRLDRKGFLSYQKETGSTICGFQPIALLLELLPKDTEARLLAYGTSGEKTGSFDNSVSYVSMVFTREGLWRKGPPAHPQEEGTTVGKNKNPPIKEKENILLTQKEKETLMGIARNTLETHVREGRTLDPLKEGYALTDALRRKSGAFVTLKKKGMLRGCIGYILPVAALYDSVIQNAVNAASHDPRFPQVAVEELPEIDIEISVLSEPRRVSSYKDIRLGEHGIILKKGFHQAVFLPQVAPEQGWDIAETLRHLSLKAGLRSDAWKDSDTSFEVFTAEVFEEERE